MKKKNSKKAVSRKVTKKSVTLSLKCDDYKEIARKAKLEGLSVKSFIMKQLTQAPELKIIPCVELAMKNEEVTLDATVPSVAKDSVIEKITVIENIDSKK